MLFERYTLDGAVPPGHRIGALGTLSRRLLRHACPIPDLVLLLDASGQTLYRRSNEYDAGTLEDWRRAFGRLERSVPTLAVIDAERPAGAVLREASERIWRLYRASVPAAAGVAAQPVPVTDITVAVAACGRPEALARCLAAISASPGAPGEVIVVDQDPSPESERVVAEHAPPGSRYLTQERLGLSASRNLALAAATRPWLAVTDDDCMPEPDWLDALADALGRAPVPAAATGAILPLGEASDGLHAVSLRTAERPRRLSRAGRCRGPSAAARTSWDRARLLRALGGWDERLGVGARGRAAEDIELLDRILRTGLVIRYEPAAVVRHERQTLQRRLATRWGYGFGIGALCGLRLRRADPYALTMWWSNARFHLRPLAGALIDGDTEAAHERARAIAGLAAGTAYGLSAPPARRPR